MSIFQTNEELRNAVKQWCRGQNIDELTRQYGHISYGKLN